MRILVERVCLSVFVGLAATCLAQAQTVALTASQEKAIGLTTAPLQAAAQAPVATLPGTFQPTPGGRAAVSAPFAGVVNQLNVIEGQTVRAGQTLAVMFSRDALAAASDLRQAQAESRVADAAAARVRQLVQEGIVAGARREEAEARADAARAVLAQRQVSVRAAGADASGRYLLRAPFAGKVSRVDVEAGQGLDAMATAFVIDRNGKLLVEAAMPADLAGRVVVGQAAVVEGVPGRIVAVGAAIDPRTRSLSVHAEVPARPQFIAGRATRIEVLGGAAGSGTQNSIARSAVTPLGGRTVVFVKSARGYVATPVTVEGYAGDRAVIRSTLPAGAPVAISGVSELKARAGA